MSAAQRRIDDTTRNLVRFDAAAGRWVSQPENVGGATTPTLQFETHFPVRTLELRGGVARNWSHADAVPGPDNRLDQQVPLSANLVADWRRDRFSAGANFGFRQAALSACRRSRRSICMRGATSTSMRPGSRARDRHRACRP
ncbi:hypothetical protein [Massilia orientalis]|uniref:Uncharacterized protein n=1 Tax=Massilia orientalis TaxID=3050128 RepID=A0ACC7M9I0_9BURK|nr:hypothetical protein [Massilia sp. YIM B02787]